MKHCYRVLFGAAAVTGFVIGGQAMGFAASTAGAAPSQAQSIVITIDTSGSSIFTASGPITGSGVYAPQTSRPTGGVSHSTGLLTLPDGSSFTVKTVGRQSDNFDPTTCIDTITGGGNYIITGGTGALSNAQGSGHYTVSASISFLLGSVCDPVNNPAVGIETITGSGQGKM